ncbi:SDR family oxidoreductase [Membranihabitans marinus]
MEKNAAIFVTGGTGFLGTYLLHLLVHRGYHNITALCRANSQRELIKDIEGQIQWVEGDLSDHQTLYDVIENQQVVIHAAGLVSFNPREEHKLYKVNTDGTANVVNACINHQTEKLIHISSIAAISKDEKLSLLNEDVEWQESKYTSIYAKSKFHGELEIWRGIAEGLNATILNPSIILGAGYWEQTSCKMFTEVYGGLKFYTPGKTGFVDVRDVVRSIVYFMENDHNGQRYIINEDNYFFKDIFEQIANHLEVKPPSKCAPKWLASTIAKFEETKALITGIRPIVTTESIRNAYKDFSYDASKVKNTSNLSFIPIAQTIEETAQLLKTSSNGPALLAFPEDYYKY